MMIAGLLDRWRRRLAGVIAVQAILFAVGVGALAAAMARVAGAPSRATVLTGLALAVTTAAGVWRRATRGRLTLLRTALWLDERQPGLRYAFVSSLEPDAPLDALQRQLRTAEWEVPARDTLRRALRWPAFLALGGLVAFVVSLRLTASPAVAAARRFIAPIGAEPSPTAVERITVLVTPPAYAHRPTMSTDDPPMVRALAGSRVELSGTLPGRASGRLPAVLLNDQPLEVQAAGSRWRTIFPLGTARALLRASAGGSTRIVSFDAVADSAPDVTLQLPARDTVLRTAVGTIALAADAHDDLGVASAAFEYIVSSGEGERFTFKSGTLGTTHPGGSLATAWRATLVLPSLALAPGDVVHVRAVARDANDVTGPGIGASETRTIRIARAGEYDSVAVDAAPPPEADKSLISQRMLINLTEALVRHLRTLSREQVVAESQRIGRDQARLRRQVSDLIFSRLGDSTQVGGEERRGVDEEARGKLSPEELLAAAERATEVNGNPLDFEGGESPVVAINRPLLEAYNAMWDAGRALGGADPTHALPPMYVALAAIQKARAAERLYLRGVPPRVVVDLARVRLQGRDRGTPSLRTPRIALDTLGRTALARLVRVVERLPANPSASIDSLLVLRLDIVDTRPLAAAALESAIDQLRTARDATGALIRARRLLDEPSATSDSLSAWGGEGAADERLRVRDRAVRVR